MNKIILFNLSYTLHHQWRERPEKQQITKSVLR